MLIDANIFLEVLCTQEKANECKKILKEIQKGKKLAILTNFTIDTILIAMERYKIEIEKKQIFLKSILRYKGLTIYNISIKDRLLALQLIEKYNLDYEDAITLQAALTMNIKKFLSFDKHFDRVKEIERIEP